VNRREHKIGDLVACKDNEEKYVLGLLIAITERHYRVEWCDGDNSGRGYYAVDIDDFKRILKEFKTKLKNGKRT